MARSHLDVYLNDHMAGSVSAIELLERIESLYDGGPNAQVIRQLRGEIEDDQRQLQDLMDRLGTSQSTTRQTAGWIADKFVRIKTLMDDTSAEGELRLFQSLEIVALGIDGKRALWDALSVVARDEPALSMDYSHLLNRAQDQRRRIELLRIAAAQAALTEKRHSAASSS